MNISFIIPGDINLPTGGYRYDRSIISELIKLGHDVDLLSLKGDYPFPSKREKSTALQLVDELNAADVTVVDGLAGGAHPEFMRKLSQRFTSVALIHHPLCLESGLDSQTSKTLKLAEHEGLKFVSGVICTSTTTAQTVSTMFELESKPVECVIPGIERKQITRQSANVPVRLLCVGSVIERKGHTYLLRALAQLKHLDWHLDCVGKTDFQPDLFSELQNLVDTFGLDERVHFHGIADECALDKFYENASVFVLPSLYEGYGMVFAEAISRGLPVISTTAGAIPNTVPKECGILVPPSQTAALSDALDLMITDTKKRNDFRQAALNFADTFPTWRDSAQKFATFLERVS